MIEEFFLLRMQDARALDPIVSQVDMNKSCPRLVSRLHHLDGKISRFRVRTQVERLSRLDVAAFSDDQLGVTFQGHFMVHSETSAFRIQKR